MRRYRAGSGEGKANAGAGTEVGSRAQARRDTAAISARPPQEAGVWGRLRPHREKRRIVQGSLWNVVVVTTVVTGATTWTIFDTMGAL